MRIVSALALAAAATGMSIAAPALAKKSEAAPAPKYTPAVGKGYNEAKKKLDAGDVAGAAAAYQALKPQAQTDDDRLIVGQLAVNIGQKNNDNALLSEGVDMMVASGKVPATSLAALYMAQGRLAYQAKDYRKAQTATLAAQQAGSVDPDLIPVLSSSMQLNGDTLGSVNVLDAAADRANASGQPVPSDWYSRAISFGSEAKGAPAQVDPIHAATIETIKKWLAAYPTKKNWRDGVLTYVFMYKVPTDVEIDVYRLLRAAGALTGDADYRGYAEDVYLRYPNEAKAVLEEGASKNVVNLTAKNDASEVLGIVKAKVAADQASLPGGEKAARASANGKTALTTADAYVGYGQYAKAIDLYKVAIQKGGIDLPTANLHMGWAMALGGDAAGAKTQFGTVTGLRKALADFWIVHLDHPTVG